MNIINPNAIEMYNSNPQKHIEAIGRICYKSEDKITDDSNKKFISGLYTRSHWAMLEHFRFIVVVPFQMYSMVKEVNSAFIACTNENGRCIVSGSARGFMDALAFIENDIKFNRHTAYGYATVTTLMAIMSHIVSDYGCTELFGGRSPCRQPSIACIRDINTSELSEYEIMMHGWHSVRFICDRGVSHELVRHRPASFAQESTRYCNYEHNKFGGEIAVIKPFFFEYGSEEYGLWEKSMRYCEEMYLQLLHCGATPQEARTVLPNSLKTDIVVTATNSEWRHIIALRYRGLTGQPHPQMKEVMSIMVSSMMWAYNLASGNYDEV